MSSIDFPQALLWYLAFVFSTTLHEASHAFTAWRLGDSTAYEGGQVTLSPVPHMRREPFGMIVVPILSFVLGGWMIGWASAPYNPQWALTYPRRSAVMAGAGPASNLLLVLVTAFIIRVGIMSGAFVAPDAVSTIHIVDAASEGMMSVVASFLNVFFSINLLLFLFNLLPVPPLDGSGILPLFMTNQAASRYLTLIRNPAFSFVGIVVVWNVFGYIFRPIHLLCVNLLYSGVASYGG